MITHMEFEDEHLSVILIHKSDRTVNMDSSVSVTLPSLMRMMELNKNQDRLHALEETLNASLPKADEASPTVRQEINAIDTALTTVGRALLFPEMQENKKTLAVTVMNLCIEYWMESTGLEKFSMARQSGLWINISMPPPCLKDPAGS